MSDRVPGAHNPVQGWRDSFVKGYEEAGGRVTARASGKLPGKHGTAQPSRIGRVHDCRAEGGGRGLVLI